MNPLRNRFDLLRKTQTTLGLTTLAALVAFYVLGYHPVARRQAALREGISTALVDLQRSQDHGRALKALAREVQQLEEQVQSYGRQMPNKPQLGEFLGDITRVSQELGLQEWKYEPETPRRADACYELPIRMHFNGAFASTADFLRQIEDLQRMTRVKKLLIRSRDRKTGTVEVDLAMNIYFAEGQ